MIRFSPKIKFFTASGTFGTAPNDAERKLRETHIVNIHHSCCAIFSDNDFDLDKFAKNTKNIVKHGYLTLFYSNNAQDLRHFGIVSIEYDLSDMTAQFVFPGGHTSQWFKFFTDGNAVFIHHQNWECH